MCRCTRDRFELGIILTCVCCNDEQGNLLSLPKRSELHSTAYTAPHDVVTIEPLEPGQLVAPVGLAAGALDDAAGALDAARVLDDAAKTLAGVHAHWYAVLEIVVVTVTVEVPGAGAAEVTGAELAATAEEEEETEEETRDEVDTGEEAATDEEAAMDEEAGAAEDAAADEEATADEEAGAIEDAAAEEEADAMDEALVADLVEMLRTSLPPIMLLFEPAALAALFR